MKTNFKSRLTIFLLCMLLNNYSYSQCYVSGPNNCDPPEFNSTHDQTKKRVLYVDHFLRFINDDASAGVNEAASILGVDNPQDQYYEKEEELLIYARDNGFNSLILYDIHNIFYNKNRQYLVNGTTRSDFYINDLRRFIQKAKTGGYGITEVSVAIGGFDLPREVKLFNGSPYNTPCILSYGRYDRNPPAPPEPKHFDYLAECNKMVKAVHDYNTETALRKYGKPYSPDRNAPPPPHGGPIPCYPDALIDRMVTEYEYWNFPFHGCQTPLLISEITINRSGAGATSPYPAYMSTTGDFIEITNTCSNSIKISGMTFNDYASNSATPVHPFTFPSPVNGLYIPANGVVTLHLGPGTDDLANNYYNTGGTDDFWGAGSAVGFVLRAGNVIIDVVGINSGYTFEPSLDLSGEFSGFAPATSGSAGCVRTNAWDFNQGSDWNESSTSPQTLGTYNSGYVVQGGDCDFGNFTVLIGNMLCAKANSVCALGVDAYIGWPGLNSNNPANAAAIAQIEWIDKHVDRTYMHVYRCDPKTSFSNSGRDRLEIFGNHGISNSIIYPIFSAESPSLNFPLFPNQGSFLGAYLTDNSVTLNPNGGYTLACAETKFQFDNDAMGAPWNDNIIEGYAWFTYNILNKNPVHPLLRMQGSGESTSDIVIDDVEDNIEIRAGDIFMVQINNLLGQIIYYTKEISEEIQIDKSQFKNGIYVLNVSTIKGEVQQKINVMH